MVALPVVKAALVLTMNVALLAPAGIVTLGGTVATFVSEDPSAMRTPAAWAFPIRETVPVDGDPPTRLNGLSEGTWRVAGSTVNEVFTATPPLAAEIVMGVGFWTPAVVTANVANVAFAGTVTLADVVATVVSELASVTTSPPVGATVERMTLPVAGSPPETTAGSTETEAKTGGSGVTTSVPVWLKPKYEARMPAFVVWTTVDVVTGNVVKNEPPGMGTLAGTAAEPARLLSCTLEPAAGTAPFRVTVPVDGFPPCTAGGLKVTETGTAKSTTSVALREDPPPDTVRLAFVCTDAPKVVT